MSAEVRVHVRIDPPLKQRVLDLCAATGLDEATLVRQSLEAIADYFDLHHEITLPLAVVPRSALASMPPRFSEASTRVSEAPPTCPAPSAAHQVKPRTPRRT